MEPIGFLTDNGAQEMDPVMNYMDSDLFWDMAFRILNAREKENEWKN